MSAMRGWATRAALLAGAAALGLGIACLIPDHGVLVLTSEFNRYPVRFVEGIPLEQEALCACNSTNCQCPLPQPTALPYYLDPVDFPFCICEGDRVDENQLPGVTLYVEDQDELDDGSPKDPLFAAALLDWDPTTGDSPFGYIAYRAYVDPQRELALSGISSYENDIIKRPRPYVREVPLRTPSTGRFDLCNGAGPKLTPGVHTLSLIVSDRPWTVQDAGDAMTTGAEEGTPSTVTLEGVPDIAAGATYDIQTYVFSCLQDGDEFCGCADQEP